MNDNIRAFRGCIGAFEVLPNEILDIIVGGWATPSTRFLLALTCSYLLERYPIKTSIEEIFCEFAKDGELRLMVAIKPIVDHSVFRKIRREIVEASGIAYPNVYAARPLAFLVASQSNDTNHEEGWQGGASEQGEVTAYQPLKYAVIGRQKEVILWLQEQSFGFNPYGIELIEVVREGDLPFCQWLLGRGAHYSVKAVFTAAFSGRLDILTFFVSKGSSFPIHSCFYHAAAHGKIDVLEYLSELNKGQRIPVLNKNSVEDIVARATEPALITLKWILEKTTFMIDLDDLLQMGCKHDYIELAQYLVQKYHGLDLNKAALISVKYGSVKCLKYLVSMGAEVEFVAFAKGITQKRVLATQAGSLNETLAILGFDTRLEFVRKFYDHIRSFDWRL